MACCNGVQQISTLEETLRQSYLNFVEPKFFPIIFSSLFICLAILLTQRTIIGFD